MLALNFFSLAELLALHIGPALAIVSFFAGYARLARWALDKTELVPLPDRPPTNMWRGLRTALLNVIFLRTAYAHDKFLWVSAMAFYVSFILIVIKHLAAAVPLLLISNVPPLALGTVFIAATLLLLSRRLFLPHVRYLTDAKEYAFASIILGVGITGFLTTALALPAPTTVSLLFGTFKLTLTYTPPSWLLYLHALFAELFVALIPFKHAFMVTGVFVSMAHGASTVEGEE